MSVPLVPRLSGNTVPSSAESFCWEDRKQTYGCTKGLRPPALETQPVRAHRHQHRTENSHLETLRPQVGLQGYEGTNPFIDEQKPANGFCEGQMDGGCLYRGLKKAL